MTTRMPAGEMIPVPISDVRIGGEIGRRIDMTIEANLLALDVDRDFLQPFRDRHWNDGYIGLGKLIDATVRFAAYSGDPRVLALKERLTAAAINLQEPDGYIGTLVPAQRHWGVYDIHETSHIVLGLANDYRYFGTTASLAAARALADYIIRCWQAEPERIPGPTGERGNMYGVTTGLDDALLVLSDVSGDSRYLDFLVTFPHYRLQDWDTSPKIGRGHMDDERHCYVFMALCVAQLDLARQRAFSGLTAQTMKAMDFLTQKDGLLVSGSCSQNEGWHSDQCGEGNVSESCATAYLIRLLDRLLRAQGDPRYGDMMERAIYNALFAAQAPDGRTLRYFTPLEGERAIFERDTFCCPNNFRRIIAELPQMAYYRRGTGLMVNLYAPSTVRLELQDGLVLGVRQETDYPTSETVSLHLDLSSPANFPLALRIPRWCTGARATINGQPVDAQIAPGEPLVLERAWNAGDRVDLQLPMPLRWVAGRQLQAGRAALLRGPVLFCLNPIRNESVTGIDLRALTVDPASTEGPFPDAAVRPGGQACRVRAWNPASNIAREPELTLLLTEFPDPGGQATHLAAPDTDEMAGDELIV